MTEPLYDTRTMWELVVARAEATPDALMFVADDDRRLTFGEFRDRAERAAAGLAGLGIRSGTRVTWQLPSRIDTVVASMALARLGAVQTPILHLYREKEVGLRPAATDRRVCCIPGEWKGFDYAAMAEPLVADLRAAAPSSASYDSLPDGDPAVLPPPPTDGDDGPLDLLHVGHHVGPQGRAPHRRGR